MSFVDMMGNDVWSEADIVNRTESIIRSKYSQTEELILNRKMSGVFSGLYTLTTDEQLELQDFNSMLLQARMAGVDARADMALLQQALNQEFTQRTLDTIPVDDPNLADQRTSLQAIIDAAPQSVKDLVAQRKAHRDALNPPPPPPPPAPAPPAP